MNDVVCSALKMGLFLHAVAPVSPTDPTVDESILHCEGLNNQSYVCESGHCCQESQCCSYYYELWWFWLVWAIIFILSCCCVCHHRRTKHRMQQQQRQHEINLIAYREAHNYTSVPFLFRFLPNYLLPDYEEVVNRPPTPPPPYSAIHTGPSTVASPLTADPQDGLLPSIQTTPVPPVSDTLCSRPSLEEPHTPTIGYRHKPLQPHQEGGTGPGSGPQEQVPAEGPAGPEKTVDCSKDPLLRNLGTEGCAEDKERVRGGGRRRRFTGDSGIEVCVCGRGRGGSTSSGGQEGKELRELESLLSCEGEDDEAEAGDFCDGCGHRAPPEGDEEQALGGLVRREEEEECGPSSSPPPTPRTPHPPVCLLLHTINEQEGPYHGNSTEPQG